MRGLEGLRFSRADRMGVWALLGVALVVLALLSGRYFANPAVVTQDDFPEYWAAGRLNLQRQDPYNFRLLAELQRAIGRSQPVMMWNPPWTLALVMPFAFLPYPLARVLWYALHLGLLLWSSDRLWRAYGGSVQKRWLAWSLALTFGPSLHALKCGQITAFLLAGLVLFLEAAREERWTAAGVALALLLIKPHLLYLVVAMALVWAIRFRRPDLLLGLVLAILAATGCALCVNPRVLHQYALALLHRPPVFWVTATLGGMLRSIFGPERFWLQFAPTVVGLGWGVAWWLHTGRCWDWRGELPPLVFLSVVTAPYGWTYDQLVLLLPLIGVTVATRFWKGPWSELRVALMIAYVLFDAWMIFSSLPQGNYWWQGLWLWGWWWAARNVAGSRSRK